MADRSLSDIANSITLSMGTEKSVGGIASIVDDISSTLYEQLNFLEMMSDSLDDLLQSRIGEGGSVASGGNDLKALVHAAQDQLKSLSDISSALDNTLAFQKEQAQDQARKDKLSAPDAPESDDAPTPEDGPNTRSREREKSDSGVFGDVLGGTLFGSILASLTSKLSLLGKSLLPGIKGLKGLLKTGAIGLVLWGLYEIFKDIGENENFQNMLVKIKEIWNTKVIPAFNSIVESLTDIGNTIASAFGGETTNNIRILVQDVFIAAFEDLASIIGSLAKSLSGAVEYVAGVVDVIAGVFTGDWERVWEGFSKVTRGTLKFFDGIIESLLTFVGADVEIDLFSAAQNAWRATIEWITEKVNTVVESIRAIPDIIAAAMDYFREGAESVGNWFSTLPTRLMLSAQELWTNTQAAFMRRIAELVDWFTSLPDRIMLSVNKFVLDKGGRAASFFGVTEESVAEQEAALESRRGMSAEALDQIEQTRLESLRAIEEQRRQLDQMSDPANRPDGGRTQVVVPPANNTTDARRITNTNNTFITTTNPLAGVDRAMPQ
jgi:hypothetical protein